MFATGGNLEENMSNIVLSTVSPDYKALEDCQIICRYSNDKFRVPHIDGLIQERRNLVR